MARHTPTPWRTAKQSPRRITTDHGVMIGNAILANSGRTAKKSSEEAEANAAMIVRAVNSHHDMVVALHNLIEFCEDVFVKPKECMDLIAAKEALAKAEAL